jgi:hypothetical protein
MRVFAVFAAAPPTPEFVALIVSRYMLVPLKNALRISNMT